MNTGYLNKYLASNSVGSFVISCIFFGKAKTHVILKEYVTKSGKRDLKWGLSFRVTASFRQEHVTYQIFVLCFRLQIVAYIFEINRYFIFKQMF